jgi:hypothetical protein
VLVNTSSDRGPANPELGGISVVFSFHSKSSIRILRCGFKYGRVDLKLITTFFLFLLGLKSNLMLFNSRHFLIFFPTIVLF